MTFPSYIPTDRRYVHGEWPITRHRFMSNGEQRMLHATAKTQQELRLTYANQSTEIVQQFLNHYDSMYGVQNSFALPNEVYGGWSGSQDLMGSQQFWQYKSSPRITSQKGEIATLQVTLITATSPPPEPEPQPEPEPEICYDILGNVAPCPIQKVFGATRDPNDPDVYLGYFWGVKSLLNLAQSGPAFSCFNGSEVSPVIPPFTDPGYFSFEDGIGIAIRVTGYPQIQYYVCDPEDIPANPPPRTYLTSIEVWNTTTGEWELKYGSNKVLFDNSFADPPRPGNSLQNDDASTFVGTQSFTSMPFRHYIPVDFELIERSYIETGTYNVRVGPDDFPPPLLDEGITIPLQSRTADLSTRTNPLPNFSSPEGTPNGTVVIPRPPQFTGLIEWKVYYNITYGARGPSFWCPPPCGSGDVIFEGSPAETFQELESIPYLADSIEIITEQSYQISVCDPDCAIDLIENRTDYMLRIKAKNYKGNGTDITDTVKASYNVFQYQLAASQNGEGWFRWVNILKITANGVEVDNPFAPQEPEPEPPPTCSTTCKELTKEFAITSTTGQAYFWFQEYISQTDLRSCQDPSVITSQAYSRRESYTSDPPRRMVYFSQVEAVRYVLRESSTIFNCTLESDITEVVKIEFWEKFRPGKGPNGETGWVRHLPNTGTQSNPFTRVSYDGTQGKGIPGGYSGQRWDWIEFNFVTFRNGGKEEDLVLVDTICTPSASPPPGATPIPEAEIGCGEVDTGPCPTGEREKFPSYHPSTRAYTLNDWNNKRFPGANSNQIVTLALPSTALPSDGKLNLSFANRADSVAQDILNHYNAFLGGFESFKLSEEIFKDWNSDYPNRIRDAEWIYDAPPQITTSHPGTSTTSVRLATRAIQPLIEEPEEPVEPIIPIPPTTRIQLFIDDSGSMELLETVLNNMVNTILKDCLLPFYDNDEALYDDRVFVLYMGQDLLTPEQTYRAAYWLEEDASGRPPTTNLINIIFQDESSLAYVDDSRDNPNWTINSPRRQAFDQDMLTLRSRLNAYRDPEFAAPAQFNATFGPEFFRTQIFQVINDGSFAQDSIFFTQLLQAAQAGEGNYTGDYSTTDIPEIQYTYGIPVQDDVLYYANLIIDTINSLGYNIPKCDL